MANSITSPVDTELEDIQTQLAFADALRKKSMDAGGRMVGNIYVNKNPWLNFVEGFAGGAMGGHQRDRQRGVEQRQLQERQNWLQEMPSATDTQHYDPVSNPGTGPLAEGMEVPKDPRALAQATQAWAMRAPRGMEGVQNFALQQAMTAPQRQAEAEQRAADRLQELQLKAIDARATAAERAEAQKEIAQMQIEGRKDMVRLAAALRPPPAPHYPPTQMTDQGLLERQPDGSWKPVKVGDAVAGKPFAPKDPNNPLTEAQGNAYLFGTRADVAHKVLDEVGVNYSPIKVGAASAVDRVPVLGSAANFTLNSNEQKVMQAQRDFVNAMLRKESGAAISQSEFDNARKQYFPQPGDSQAVIDQKRANRETAIAGMAKIVGPQGADIGKGSGKPSSGSLTAAEQEELDALRAKHGRK